MKKTATQKEMQLKDIKELFVAKILSMGYKNINAFLNSEEGQKLGGRKLSPVLYGTKTISLKSLQSVADFLGYTIERTTKRVVVQTYKITENGDNKQN